MIRLLLIIAVLVVVIGLMRHVKKLPRARRQRLLIKAAIGALLALLILGAVGMPGALGMLGAAGMPGAAGMLGATGMPGAAGTGPGGWSSFGLSHLVSFVALFQ